MKKFILIVFLISYTTNLYSKDLFVTTFYDVEFISSSIENDKIAKIQEIKKESILEIFKRILEDRNYNELKKNISDDSINILVKNIIINDEKIFNDKYISKIKVNFNKKKIVNYLRKKRIPYIDFYPDKFLLIIYDDNNLTDNIFTEKNYYYDYLKKNLGIFNNFKVPNLDINDRFILKRKDINDRNLEKINNFSIKYNIKDIIVFNSLKSKSEFNYNILLYLDGKIFEKKLFINNSDLENLFKIIEKETFDFWKSINQIQNTSLKSLDCNINYFNMLELKEIRSNLDKISVIYDLKIKLLSYKKIQYKILFYGNFKIFSQLLNLNQLKINSQNSTCTIGLK